MSQEWEKRAKHQTDFNAAFRQSGCAYFPGTTVLRQYNGKEFWQEFKSLGHSKTDFDKCQCRQR